VANGSLLQERRHKLHARIVESLITIQRESLEAEIVIDLYVDATPGFVHPTGCRARNWRAMKALIMSMARSVCRPG
jgi:hypothetical protein